MDNNEGGSEAHGVRLGNLELDAARFELRREGQTVPVEPQVLELLLYLVAHRDRAVTRTELFDNLWKGRVVSDSALNSRIKAARSAIGDDGKAQSGDSHAAPDGLPVRGGRRRVAARGRSHRRHSTACRRAGCDDDTDADARRALLRATVGAPPPRPRRRGARPAARGRRFLDAAAHRARHGCGPPRSPLPWRRRQGVPAAGRSRSPCCHSPT